MRFARWLIPTLMIFQPNFSAAESQSTAGIPALPCAKIIEWKDDAVMFRGISDWLYGFWTGWNFANSLSKETERDLGDATVERDALSARVLAYCYENKDELLMGTAIEFYFMLPILPVSSEN